MKAVIPVAGAGSRLRPHTFTTPKALLYVADKPLIGHILDRLADLNVDKVVLVIGHMGEKIVEYVSRDPRFKSVEYVEQGERKGLGHAISLAQPCVIDEPILTVYGDTIIEGDLSEGLDDRVDAKIGVKRVEDPKRFGVVCLDGKRVVRLVEKPESPVSDMAIAGVNYVRNSRLLFDCLKELVERDIKTRGEYQLTDAFQLMIDRGANIEVFQVENWFDCGNPETLLSTNRYLLSKRKPRSIVIEGSTIVDPVFISENAEVKNSIVGPYVSVADGAEIENSIIRDSIIGEKSKVLDCVLESSLIGNHASVKGVPRRFNIGDFSMIDFT